ncbi:hypothetical protein N7456_012543 [Penicillium angulare]|uniref:Uncharacterized protein n=1 Tax=Penicillium angulare TaxID=116970 RepID=A0A9W9JVP5_9EURO|nr:hypothetical protein N7456_012543 [Penicillium angulare]
MPDRPPPCSRTDVRFEPESRTSGGLLPPSCQTSAVVPAPAPPRSLRGPRFNTPLQGDKSNLTDGRGDPSRSARAMRRPRQPKSEGLLVPGTDGVCGWLAAGHT